jgi:hypothetical protein
MTVGTMEAAFIKGNNRPGDVRRLVPNGVMVSVQIFIGYIETNPLWHVLNSLFHLWTDLGHLHQLGQRMASHSK